MFEAHMGVFDTWVCILVSKNADDDVDDDGDGDDVILGSKNNAVFGTLHGL